MLTEVGASMGKTGCDGIELGPMHESVCFLILLCSALPIDPNVVEDKPACRKLRVSKQQEVDPTYDNSHLPHTYL